MIRKLVSWVAALAATVALASCSYLSPSRPFDLDAERQPVKCVQILDERLLQFPFGQFGPEETELRILDAYGVKPEKILATTGAVYLNWIEGGRRYSMYLYPDERTEGASVQSAENPPSVEEVLECFREPSFVYAYHDLTPDGPAYTVLQLWYAELGVEFGSSVPAQLDSVDPRMPMSGVSYSRPGTIKDMILARYEVEPDSDEFQRILTSIKRWPGSLDLVEIGDPPY